MVADQKLEGGSGGGGGGGFSRFLVFMGGARDEFYKIKKILQSSQTGFGLRFI